MQDTILSRRTLLAGSSLAVGGIAVTLALRTGADQPEAGVVRVVQPDVHFAARVMPWDDNAYARINADGPALMLL